MVSINGKNLWLNIKNELKCISVDKIGEYQTENHREYSLNYGQRAEIKSLLDRFITVETFQTTIQDRMSMIRSSTEEEIKVLEAPISIYLMEKVPQSDLRSKSAEFSSCKTCISKRFSLKKRLESR